MSYTKKTEIGISESEKTIKRFRALDHEMEQIRKREVPRKSTIREGWIGIGETLTYASGTTVTFSTIEQPTSTGTEYRCNLEAGMKLCFVQSGTTKYFTITDVTSPLVATTTLTLDGGGIYTVENETITSPKYSIAEHPKDFPFWSGAGTVFPSNPTTGVRYFRTDLGFECYYDGTRWLTVQEFVIHINKSAEFSADGSIGTFAMRSDYETYFTRCEVNIYLGATNDGSNYWELEVDGYDADWNNYVSYVSESFAALADSTSHHVVCTIDTATDPDGNELLDIRMDENGSPSNCTVYGVLIAYRLIIT